MEFSVKGKGRGGRGPVTRIQGEGNTRLITC